MHSRTTSTQRRSGRGPPGIGITGKAMRGVVDRAVDKVDTREMATYRLRRFKILMGTRDIPYTTCAVYITQEIYEIVQPGIGSKQCFR